ncbi:hypothetical protein CB1_000778001 [Camelus ferus]|nr:hypothetical protein CB1_000778001 [Camelus ferus]
MAARPFPAFGSAVRLRHFLVLCLAGSLVTEKPSFGISSSFPIGSDAASWKVSTQCRPFEDCCGSRCCVRALSIQRLWYFWFLLMMGVLFCCGAGFFIRRRMYPPPLIEEPAFNVSYTRQPASSTPVSGLWFLSWAAPFWLNVLSVSVFPDKDATHPRHPLSLSPSSPFCITVHHA